MKVQRLLPLLFTCLICITQLIAQNSPAPIKLIDIVLTPDASDWNYDLNKVAGVKIQVLKYGVPLKGIKVHFATGAEMMPADNRGDLHLTDGTGVIKIGTMPSPGFRQLGVSLLHNGRLYTNMVKVGYAVEKIQPTVLMPDDFNSFWNSAKKEAAALPIDAVVTAMPGLSDNQVDVYLVSLQNYRKGRRIYGYLCKPKAPGKYPVVFSPPGAGIKQVVPAISFAQQGFISFSIEIHGISPEVESEAYRNISNAFGDYWLHKLDDADNYYYKSVYLGCVRAIDFLCSLPEFDGKNVVVTGGSQGGALSMVAAGLDSRVTSVAAFYPALCDITGYLFNRAGGWPHMLNSSGKMNNTPAKLRTIGYYDVVNFAKNIKVPGFYSWGYNDNVVPPTSVFAAVNSIKAPKTISITPISGHWRFEETNQESIEWIRKQLK